MSPDVGGSADPLGALPSRPRPAEAPKVPVEPPKGRQPPRNRGSLPGVSARAIQGAGEIAQGGPPKRWAPAPCRRNNARHLAEYGMDVCDASSGYDHCLTGPMPWGCWWVKQHALRASNVRRFQMNDA